MLDRIWILVIVSLSGYAQISFASCPQLQGTYKCKDSSTSVILDTFDDNGNGAYEYFITDEALDLVDHPVQVQPDSMLMGSNGARCIGGKILFLEEPEVSYRIEGETLLRSVLKDRELNRYWNWEVCYSPAQYHAEYEKPTYEEIMQRVQEIRKKRKTLSESVSAPSPCAVTASEPRSVAPYDLNSVLDEATELPLSPHPKTKKAKTANSKTTKVNALTAKRKAL